MENANRTIDMQRKKLKRSTTNKKADTPRTKTRKLLRHFGKADSNVRKTLTFHYTIMQQIREKYRQSRQKRIICATIIGELQVQLSLKERIRSWMQSIEQGKEVPYLLD